MRKSGSADRNGETINFMKLNQKEFATGQMLDKPLHNVDKETYLSQFDNTKSGPIHVQKWAIKNVQDFHNSLIHNLFL